MIFEATPTCHGAVAFCTICTLRCQMCCVLQKRLAVCWLCICRHSGSAKPSVLAYCPHYSSACHVPISPLLFIICLCAAHAMLTCLCAAHAMLTCLCAGHAMLTCLCAGHAMLTCLCAGPAMLTCLCAAPAMLTCLCAAHAMLTCLCAAHAMLTCLCAAHAMLTHQLVYLCTADC